VVGAALWGAFALLWNLPDRAALWGGVCAGPCLARKCSPQAIINLPNTHPKSNRLRVL